MILMETKVSRRNDPNCEEVRGWVEQEVARRFKSICTEQGKNYSEGLEEALLLIIKLWGRK